MNCNRNSELSIRLAYNLFTQRNRNKLSDFQSWTKMTKPARATSIVSWRGRNAGFLRSGLRRLSEPRPDMLPVMESELKAVIRHLVENRWPFRLHATYNETIERVTECL